MFPCTLPCTLKLTSVAIAGLTWDVVQSELDDLEAHGDPTQVYRARQPVFESFSTTLGNQSGTSSVRLAGIIKSDAPLNVQYQPNHPDANAEGNVYVSNVNTIEEMVNMLSASRSYQNSVELMNTTKQLLLKTLSLGR